MTRGTETHQCGPNMALAAPGLRNHFVYHVLNRRGEVIYIGCTRRPERRWKDHRRDLWRQDMVSEACRFKMFGPYDFPTARRIERAHTFDLKPKHNAIPITRDRREAHWWLGRKPHTPYIDGIPVAVEGAS